MFQPKELWRFKMIIIIKIGNYIDIIIGKKQCVKLSMGFGTMDQHAHAFSDMLIRLFPLLVKRKKM